MELEIYPRLQPESRLAMRRTKWRYGNIYVYRPRSNLVRRLAQELSKSEEQIREQINKERQFLIAYPQYF